MSASTEFTIRRAVNADIDRIVEIAEANRYDGSGTQDSFLVSDFTADHYSETLFSDGYDQSTPDSVLLEKRPLAYVAEHEDQVVGFVYIYSSKYSRKTFPEQPDLPKNEKPGVTYYPRHKTEVRIDRLLAEKTDFLVIKQIGVHPDWKKNRIASSLYQHVFSQFFAPHIFAAIVERPINKVSQKFHASLGFTPVSRSISGELGAPDVKLNQIWYRPGLPIVQNVHVPDNHVFEGNKSVSGETLTESIHHSRTLYLHEDSLNWIKLNVTITILFALMAALYLLTQNQERFAGLAVLFVVGIGSFVLFLFRATLKSGIDFMRSHKDNLRIAESRMLFHEPLFQGSIRHVPKRALTIAIMNHLPKVALITWTIACVLALLVEFAHWACIAWNWVAQLQLP
ncbi:MAG: GNAT family N-acetyltransferase [Henriciella sp.]|nr:GNAT family N-acetyltransferase [Henriciella sp.]